MEDIEQLRLLGRGGYASVYLCRRPNSDDLFALKRISKTKVATPQQKQRVAAEKFILQEVKSPFLCRGFESFETEEEIVFVQEFIEGRPLYECIWQYKDTGKFPENVAKFFAAQLVLALRDLHGQGCIHRDLKSGNVLVDQQGFVKVIDFGLAKSIGIGQSSSDEVTERTQSTCGTHYVMAPEVFFRKPYGFAVDWWGLGVVIYEMVIGRPPWEYQCPPESSMDQYFQKIKSTASTPFKTFDEGDAGKASPCDDFQSLIKDLLRVKSCERLGYKGAAEVMQHPWFKDVDWKQLEAKEYRRFTVVVPYNSQTDYNASRTRMPPSSKGLVESLSSAESIDPEDNAKYFADF